MLCKKNPFTPGTMCDILGEWISALCCMYIFTPGFVCIFTDPIKENIKRKYFYIYILERGASVSTFFTMRDYRPRDGLSDTKHNLTSNAFQTLRKVYVTKKLFGKTLANTSGQEKLHVSLLFGYDYEIKIF